MKPNLFTSRLMTLVFVLSLLATNFSQVAADAANCHAGAQPVFCTCAVSGKRSDAE